jgi:TolB-like protein
VNEIVEKVATTLRLIFNSAENKLIRLVLVETRQCSGADAWTQRFDFPVTDIFAVQECH